MNDDKWQKIREYNVIWDFANNYKFLPQKSFPMDQKYLNMVYGGAKKIFDFSLIESFFTYIKKDNTFYDDFKFMTELLISHIAYLDLRDENLVIDSERISYAKKVRSKYELRDPQNIREQFEKAYYGKILGSPIVEGGLFLTIYKALFAIDTRDTATLIEDLNEFFERHFAFARSAQDRDKFENMVKEKKAKNFDQVDTEEEELSENFIEDQFGIGSAEFSGNIYFEEKKLDKDRNLMFLNKGDETYHESAEFIEDFYGLSVLNKERVKAIENKVAKGIHSGKKLYFTRGEYTTKANALFYKKNRKKLADETKNFIEGNRAINNRSINELSMTIKNSLANFYDYEETYKSFGIIDSTKAWRAGTLNDYKVFKYQENREVNKFKIDLLLDGSASQIKRAKLVANQAYIIEKAMDKLNIPIRVMSYSTLRDYTVFNLYRDYEEKANNEKIYNFMASGSNRDGLAYKVIHQIIDSKDPTTKNILIILSDGKPNDLRSNINTVKLYDKDQYVDENAVEDTGKEVRNLREDNITTLGVFTGEDEDVQKAKLIYGADFCRITSIENFSKIVSIFLKTQIFKA